MADGDSSLQVGSEVVDLDFYFVFHASFFHRTPTSTSIDRRVVDFEMSHSATRCGTPVVTDLKSPTAKTFVCRFIKPIFLNSTIEKAQS